MHLEAQLLVFARTLAGHYSNLEQSIENPKDFAHINIFFRPLPWKVLNGPGYYSEQSYDYDPWRPYRQGIHLLRQENGHFTVDNFGLNDPIRLAGAGRHPELLSGIHEDNIKKRCGCAMNFIEIAPGSYQGRVEPGKKCLIPRDGRLSYLVSEVTVDANTWISRDRGFDPETDQQLWGSEHGALRFRRVMESEADLHSEWLTLIN